MKPNSMRMVPLFVTAFPIPFTKQGFPQTTTMQATSGHRPTPRNRKNRHTDLETRLKIDTIQAGAYRISGISIAATETCVWVPSLSLAFDAGKCPVQVVPMRYMAITHGHCDHVHGLPLHCATRSLQNMARPLYYVPSAIRDDVDGLVDAVARLEQSDMHAEVTALVPGGEGVALKRGWWLKAFETFHTVPSQGYIVYQRRRKLNAEFVGMAPGDLKALRMQGVPIEREELVPEIAFTGDTTLSALEKCEDARKAKVLITEMTFLDGAMSVEDARRFGHVHLAEVIEKAPLFERNEHVIFTHFSARYSASFVRQALRKLPDELRQKSFALGVGPIWDEDERDLGGVE